MEMNFTTTFEEQRKEMNKIEVNQPVQIEEERYDYFETQEEHETLEEEELEALNAQDEDEMVMKTSPMNAEVVVEVGTEMYNAPYFTQDDDTIFDTEEDGPIEFEVQGEVFNNQNDPIVLDDTEDDVVMAEPSAPAQIPIIAPEAVVEEAKKTKKARKVAKKAKRVSKKKKTTKKKKVAKKAGKKKKAAPKRKSSKKKAARKIAKTKKAGKRTVKK